MIDIKLNEKYAVENFKAVMELRKTGRFTDEEIQCLYDRQVAIDEEKAVRINAMDKR